METPCDSTLPPSPSPLSPPTSTGLFFDSRCLLHQANYNHVEGFSRLLRSYEAVVNQGLWNKCKHIQVAGCSPLDVVDNEGRKYVYGSSTPGLVDNTIDRLTMEKKSEEFIAPYRPMLKVTPAFHHVYDVHHPLPLLDDEDILLVHTKDHLEFLKSSREFPYGEDELDSETEDDPVLYPDCQFITDDTYVNRYSYAAACTAASGVVHLTRAVCQGHLHNAYAMIRPPGHHAGITNNPTQPEADGFCLLNNLAIAARVAQRDFPCMIKRVLIVDFDVHHGNGTQHCFYDDPSVLFFSIHSLYDHFFPGTGDHHEIGHSDGVGFTVNHPLHTPITDYEYLLAFALLFIPIACQFDPHLVFISAGYDALSGDPVGNMQMTWACIYMITQAMMSPRVCASQRVVAATEGGYNAQLVADGTSGCVRALLGEEIPGDELYQVMNNEDTRHIRSNEDLTPFYNVLYDTISIHQPYWSVLSGAYSPHETKEETIARWMAMREEDIISAFHKSYQPNSK